MVPTLCHCSEKVRQGGAKKGGILPLFLKVEPRQCHHRFHVIYGLGPGYLCDCSHLVPATSHRQRVPWLCRWRKNWLASDRARELGLGSSPRMHFQACSSWC